MSNEYELLVNKINTAVYIDSDPTDIAMIPRTREGDGAGGFRWVTGAPLAVQRIRVVTSSALSGTVRRTVDGESVQPDLLVVATFDALVERGYLLPLADDVYEVVFIQPDMRYEKLVEVIRRG